MKKVDSLFLFKIFPADFTFPLGISFKNHSFDEELKNQAFLAENWIINQARRYGVTRNIISSNYKVSERVSAGDVLMSPLSNKLLKKTEYRTIQNILNKSKTIRRFNRFAVMVFINKAGRSNVTRLKIGDDFIYEIKIFTKCNCINEISGIIAHEILHVYGAPDLYFGSATPRRIVEYANRVYPKDIMSCFSYNLETATLSPLTAYFVGLIAYQSQWRSIFPREY